MLLYGPFFAVLVLFVAICMVCILIYGILLCVDAIHPPSRNGSSQAQSAATSSPRKANSGLWRLTMKELLEVVREVFAPSVSVYHNGRQGESDVVGKEVWDVEALGEQSETKEHVCSICLLPYENGDRVLTVSTCKHIFHEDCLVQWLAKGNCECPFCRGEVMTAKCMHDAAIQVLGKERVREVAGIEVCR